MRPAVAAAGAPMAQRSPLLEKPRGRSRAHPGHGRPMRPPTPPTLTNRPRAATGCAAGPDPVTVPVGINRSTSPPPTTRPPRPGILQRRSRHGAARVAVPGPPLHPALPPRPPPTPPPTMRRRGPSRRLPRPSSDFGGTTSHTGSADCGRAGGCRLHRTAHRASARLLGRARNALRPAFERARHGLVDSQRPRRHGCRPQRAPRRQRR